MADFEHVVVLVPGISGSALSKDRREVWGTSGGALWRAVTTGGDSIRELALNGPDDPSLDDLGDGVQATRLIPDLHIIPGFWKVDGYSGISSSLVADLGLRPGENFFEFPYDWRRTNQVSATKLSRAVATWLNAWRDRSGSTRAKLILVAHSMGGLVARYYLEVLGGWQDSRALITFGTPYRGSLNAVGFLANGYSKAIGPIKFDFASTLRSFDSVYELLPTYPCIDLTDGQLHRINEIDNIPNIDVSRVLRALEFHRSIERKQSLNQVLPGYHSDFTVFPVVGVDQPTFQSARLTAERRVELTTDYMGRDLSGDGTVPRVSAVPLELGDARREMFSSEAHASLQNASAVLTHAEGAVSGLQIDPNQFRKQQITLSLDVDDAYSARDYGEVRIRAYGGHPKLLARIFDAASGRQADAFELRTSPDGMYRGSFELEPGLYRMTVSGLDDPGVQSVTDGFVVVETARSRGRRLRAIFERGADLYLSNTIAESPASDIGKIVTVEDPFAGIPVQQQVEGLPGDQLRTFPNPIAAVEEPPEPDEGTSITRHPSIEPLGHAIPGQYLKIRVDLLLSPEVGQAEGITIGDLAPDWREVFFDVDVQSAQMTFEPGKSRSSIIVRRNERSRPCEIIGLVRPEAGAEAEVMILALFSHKGRFCGFSRARIPLQGIARVADKTVVQPQSASTTSVAFAPEEAATAGLLTRPLGVEGVHPPASSPPDSGIIHLESPQAPAADLTVNIFSAGRPGCFIWSLDVADRSIGLPDPLHGYVDLGTDSPVFAEELLKDAAELPAGNHLDALNGVGELLFTRAPECFKKSYSVMRKKWAKRNKDGEPPQWFSIQFIIDDPYVPWELMRPHWDDEDGNANATPILALDHPVARFVAAYRSRMQSRLPSRGGRIVSIAPKYEREVDRLKCAEQESYMLCRDHGAIPLKAEVADVKNLLKQGRPDTKVAIVHFAGHGAFDAKLADSSRLLLERSGILMAREVSVVEVALGQRDGTVVVLNACQVGAIGGVLGSIGGWADALTKRRFRGVLAPLWSVRDEHASRFILSFIEAVWKGNERVGEALRRTRSEQMRASSTPFAYVFYGDVNAQFL